MRRSVVLAGLTFAAMTSLAPGQARKAEDLRSEVEGLNTILFLKPEGTKVKKGELVCELDSAPLRDKLINQEIATKRAQADLDNARKSKQVAEINRDEVKEGLDQAVESLEAEIKIVRLDIKIDKEKIENAKAAQGTGQGRGEIDKATADLARHEAALSKAEARLKPLKTFTRARKLAEAEIDVSKAEADRSLKEAIAKLEESKEAKLRRMIAKCKINAPIDGRVSYANPEDPRPDTPWIEEGATVRERQKILRITPE